MNIDRIVADHLREQTRKAFAGEVGLHAESLTALAQRAYDAGRADERERAAKVADEMFSDKHPSSYSGFLRDAGRAIAAAIRATPTDQPKELPHV